MEQLKMYWFPGTPIEDMELPEGYSFSNYKNESDIDGWVKCCQNGLVSDNYEEARQAWFNTIIGRPDIDIYNDVFFLDYKGEHVGTITCYLHSEDGTGDMHMVGMRTDFRGRGLGKYMNNKALKHIEKKNPKFVHLTTDEWRKAAVKSYLRAGFHPVKYSINMKKRWEAELEEIGVDSVDMYTNSGKFYKTIYRKGLKK
ncbi:MAG: GNAT family N-acetyltransferase [Clostridia bacterium]|nr:GNAT family N-acetyltransferase [Clostridia bacterium]